MRSTLLVTFAAAALLGWGLPVDAGAQGQSSTAGGSTSTDQSQSSQSAGAPGTTAPGMQPGAQMGAGTSAGAPGQLTQAKLQSYIQARQFLESQDPNLKRAMESRDITARRDKLAKLLSSQHREWPSAEEFIQIHQQVHQDPGLRAQVEAELKQRPGRTGAAGAAGGPRGPADTSGTEQPGAQPGAPQQGTPQPGGPGEPQQSR